MDRIVKVDRPAPQQALLIASHPASHVRSSADPRTERRVTGRVAHTGGMDRQPDDTNPLLFTAMFLVGVVVVAVLYGLVWLMYGGN